MKLSSFFFVLILIEVSYIIIYISHIIIISIPISYEERFAFFFQNKKIVAEQYQQSHTPIREKLDEGDVMETVKEISKAIKEHPDLPVKKVRKKRWVCSNHGSVL